MLQTSTRTGFIPLFWPDWIKTARMHWVLSVLYFLLIHIDVQLTATKQANILKMPVRCRTYTLPVYQPENSTSKWILACLLTFHR